MPKGGNTSGDMSHQTSQQFAPNNGMMMNRGFGGGSQGSFMAPSNMQQMTRPQMPQLQAPTFSPAQAPMLPQNGSNNGMNFPVMGGANIPGMGYQGDLNNFNWDQLYQQNPWMNRPR